MSNAFVALLRAVNVGGTGKLPMADLKRLCEKAGFSNVQTYIASGNVIFQSKLTTAQAKALLISRLERYTGKPVGVIIRTPAEMEAIVEKNPFPDCAPNRTIAIFLDGPVAANVLDGVTGQKDEQIKIGKNEIYVHYGEGMAASKLKIPYAKNGTARNINTITKLAELAAGYVSVK
jgi:uncharacterized protein (DUF1697 family)